MTVTKDALKHSNDNFSIPAKISTSFSSCMTDYPNDLTVTSNDNCDLNKCSKRFLNKTLPDHNNLRWHFLSSLGLQDLTDQSQKS